MGLFNIFYPNRPGKGVDRDEPPKHAFFQFWTLIWRKLSRFVLLNVMYFVAVSPLLFVLLVVLNDFFGFVPLDPEHAAAVAAATEESGGYLPALGWFVLMLYGYILDAAPPVLFGLIIVSALLYGPLTCGFTYILRNFARQEHAWMSDFWARAKANFIPGLKMGLLELLFLLLMYASITATGAEGVEASLSLMMTVCRYAMFGVLLIYLFMRNYLYVMVVTFDLKIRAVVRNAFFFAVLGLPRNLIVLLGQAAVILALIAVNPVMYGMLEFLLLLLIAVSLLGFISIFTTYPVIQRFMLEPMRKKEEEEQAGEA